MGEIRPNHYNSVKDLLCAVADRGLLQAAGSWSLDACCAVPGNDCGKAGLCYDRTSSSDWLFGLWPGPPQRFEPTGANTGYQYSNPAYWPTWGGSSDDLCIGGGESSAAPGGENSACQQGKTYHGTPGEICGQDSSVWDVEVWYPR